VTVTGVEIDSEIVRIAEQYFGMPKDNEKLKVVVDDGLKVLENTG